MTALLEVRDLAKAFDVSAPWLQRVLARQPRRLLQAVDGVGFSIPRGQTLALVGESGCGKSTVARLLLGLYAPDAGHISFDGQDVPSTLKSAQGLALRRRMQMIFQDPYASLNPRWTVGRIVAEPVRTHGLAGSTAELQARVGELLTSVGFSRAGCAQVPAPVFRRPAPAHFDCSRTRHDA